MTSHSGPADNKAQPVPENPPVTALPEMARSETDVTPGLSPNLRSAALWVIAVIISLAALRSASSVFVPLVLGLILSYALGPLVNQMVRFYIPRVLAAAILLFGLIAGTGAIIYSLAGDAVELIESLPEMAQKLRKNFDALGVQGPVGTVEKVQKAASEIERTATEGENDPEPATDVTKVQIEKPKLNVTDYLVLGTVGVAEAVAKVAVVFFIAFFLLASGDRFRRKMVKLAGPTLGQKKLTLHALDEINEQIQRYLLVQVFTSVLVGVTTWLAFLWIGVEHAAVWGVVSFIFNFIPYFGSLIASAAAMLAGFVQFGSFEVMLLIGGVGLLINTLEGNLLTPWLTSRAGRMNPVAVFAGVLAWGWLWGVWGFFLAVPILMVTKTVCDRVENFKAVGELLGE